MNVVFHSDMSAPDPRWQTRHTPTPDLPAADFAARYTDKGRLQLGLAERDGKIHTTHLATLDRPFTYGRFEARMRFPSGQGAHSAFWLQDVTPDHIGGAEVDIIEHFGSDRRLWHNVYWRTPTTMWPEDPAEWRASTTAYDPRTWHTYGLDWHPDRYEYTIDGKVSAVSTDGLSAMPKVLILSLLSSTWEWPRRVADLSAYRTMVDWVRVTDLGDGT